jgi:hypothetical protein
LGYVDNVSGRFELSQAKRETAGTIDRPSPAGINVVVRGTEQNVKSSKSVLIFKDKSQVMTSQIAANQHNMATVKV